MRKWCSLAAFVLLPIVAYAQSEPQRAPDSIEPTPRNYGGMLENPHFKEIMDKVRGLGPWNEQAEWITEAHQAVWERNGWNTESDLFAMHLVTAVERCPPWRLDRRIDTMVRMTAERYSLDAQQQADLRARMTGEALGFIGRYAPSIVYGFQLFFETRAEGKPLDAETVGELVRTVRPIYKDIVAEVDRSLDEFGETLRPEQHEVFERDRAAFDKRISYVAGKLDDWAAGRWKPEEWGIDKDPLWQARHQGEAEKPAASEPAEDSVRSRAAERPEAGPGYETAWELYVRRFIAQYHLDEAQQTTAWAILADLQDQAAKHWEKHADEHESLVRRPQAAQSAQELEQRRARLAELEAPIDALFGELKHRLDALPTAAQRRAADATPHSPDRP